MKALFLCLLGIVIIAYTLLCFCCDNKPEPNNRPVIATKKCKELMRKHGITTLVTDHEKNEVYFIRGGRKITVKTDACKE
jgi:hypothetical protein